MMWMRHEVLAFVIVGGAGMAQLWAQSKPEQELMKIEDDWCAADLKRDAAMHCVASQATLVAAQQK